MYIRQLGIYSNWIPASESNYVLVKRGRCGWVKVPKKQEQKPTERRRYR